MKLLQSFHNYLKIDKAFFSAVLLETCPEVSPEVSKYICKKMPINFCPTWTPFHSYTNADGGPHIEIILVLLKLPQTVTSMKRVEQKKNWLKKSYLLQIVAQNNYWKKKHFFKKLSVSNTYLKLSVMFFMRTFNRSYMSHRFWEMNMFKLSSENSRQS